MEMFFIEKKLLRFDDNILMSEIGRHLQTFILPNFW